MPIILTLFIYVSKGENPLLFFSKPKGVREQKKNENRMEK